MNYLEIESMTYAFGIGARCCLCEERMPLHEARKHSRIHGYPLGGDFTLTVNAPHIRTTNTAYRAPSPMVLRTSKWA